jgi:hypothetical protein
MLMAALIACIACTIQQALSVCPRSMLQSLECHSYQLHGSFNSRLRPNRALASASESGTHHNSRQRLHLPVHVCKLIALVCTHFYASYISSRCSNCLKSDRTFPNTIGYVTCSTCTGRSYCGIACHYMHAESLASAHLQCIMAILLLHKRAT